MLGKTAGGLFWMFRYLERAENTTRLIDAGFRIALTRPRSENDEWSSMIAAAGVTTGYLEKHDDYDAMRVIDFLLRDPSNPSSVLSIMESARNNAKMVRTALTREVWEATNEAWMGTKDALARPIKHRNLIEVLGITRQHAALVRAALHGTMLRNDIYDFSRIGTFLERADNTARILDVKYYVLLPSISHVGSALDNIQWEMILRSVSAQRSYRWLNGSDINARGIADFLILDGRMPRSLAFCYTKIIDNLGYLEKDYKDRHDCHDQAQKLSAKLHGKSIDQILDYGLHEFISAFVQENTAVAQQVESDYRFYG
ncbi:MAG: alpha-E domain-containing protein [Pseudomonadota bacterium]